MKIRSAILATSLTALATVCAAEQQSAADGEDANDSAESCRYIVENGKKSRQPYCGTAEQWAEFDRRVAQINAEVTCRPSLPYAHKLCLSEAQWKDYEHRATKIGRAVRMGQEGRYQWSRAW